MGISQDAQEFAIVEKLASPPEGKSLFEQLEAYLKAFLENNPNYSTRGELSEAEMELIAIAINQWFAARTPSCCRGVIEANTKSLVKHQLEILNKLLARQLKNSGIETLLNQLTDLQMVLEKSVRSYEVCALEFKGQKESWRRTYLDLMRSLTHEIADSTQRIEYFEQAWNAFCLSCTNQLRAEVYEVALFGLRHLIETVEKYVKTLTDTSNLMLSLSKEFLLEIASMQLSEATQILVSIHLDSVELSQLRYELEKELNSSFACWGRDRATSSIIRYKLLNLVQPIALELYRQGIRELLT